MMVSSESPLPEEAAGRKTRALTAKSATRIGYWNVRTLNEPTKLAQVVKEMDAYNTSILGLSEVRWTKSGEFKDGNKTVLFSGRQDDIHREGVAMILSKDAKAALEEWEPVNERLLKARFITQHARVSIIQCYAPTNQHDDSKKDEFYLQLQDQIDKIPSHDIKIVMGDLNAQIGGDRSGFESVLGPHAYGRRTDNGDRFIQCCSMNDLKIGSSMFQHKDIHKVSWISNDHVTKTQIDHFALGPAWRSTCVQDVRCYRGADVGSDHNLAIAKIKIKLKRRKKKPKVCKKFDVGKLNNDDVREEFKISIRNRFDILTECPPGTEVWWDQLKDAMNEAGESTLGYQKPLKEEWISNQTWDLIEERKQLHIKRQNAQPNDIDNAAYEAYRNKDKEVKRSAQRDKREWLDAQADAAEEAAARNDMRTVYRIAKKITNNTSTRSAPIKSKDGRVLSKGEEKLARWAEHFKEVLNRPQPDTPAEPCEPTNILPIETDIFTKKEARKAISMMKNNKAPGMDGIAAEMLKAGDDTVVDWILKICNGAWTENVVPQDWKDGAIICLPKKGNLSDCDNWRGVALLSIPGKVYCQMILNRMRNVVDTQLREEQAGFRPKRSCAEQIFTLRRIIEKCQEYQVPLAVSFIDFSKAFDSIHRPSLWKVLISYGIPEKVVNAIEQIYSGSRCCIRTDDGLSDWFQVLTGVRQGCILSPILFAIAIDWVLTKATKDRGIDWLSNQKLSDLDFADDIAALAKDTPSLQQLVGAISGSAKELGLLISIKKTKNMLQGDHHPPLDVFIGQDKIDNVEDFTYLGSSINAQGDMTKEINCRIGKASAAFNQLNKIWSSKKFSLKTKLRFYNTNVLSTLLYGCETWYLKITHEKKLDAFDSKCLRKILHIKWNDFITNKEVRERSKQPLVSATICKRRLKWLGHVARLPPDRLANQALWWTPLGRRRRGRPKMNWKQNIQQDLKGSLTSWKDIKTLTADRPSWRVMTASCVGRRGSY